MTLKKLDDNRFHATIQNTDKSGKLHKREFEGTREQIQKQIMEDKDLTPMERAHLLRGLNMEPPGVPVWIIPDEASLDF